ncbi:MAG TPA: putative sugar nucleotidyl transferase [Longimicrobiales bacterium]|nr:putative sugar nucleotidyl transferase [Longimicrobiales bacterium]
MADAALVLFDDIVARRWEPFALTRPAGELRYGIETLRERAERVLGLPCIGHLTAPHLAGYDEPWGAAVLDGTALPQDRELVFWSARAVPDSRPAHEQGAAVFTLDGEVCGWRAPAGQPHPDAADLLGAAAAAPSGAPTVEVRGELLVDVWDLMLRGPDRVARDVELHPWGRRALDAGTTAGAIAALGAGLLGDGAVVLEEGVEVEPGVVLDVREGPIWLGRGVKVHAFSRLAGPTFVGASSTVLGGSISASTIGPHCKVRGEVEASTFLGWSNKAHDGFLGHAYLGAWVNLGAMTTNSDLKNNYGPVRLWTPEGERDTGSIKVGCFLGDHAKTGIGTLLNTGTVVGAGSNLYGAAMPPKHVPPFSWGSGGDLVGYDLERFLDTAARVMARRDVKLTPGQRELLGEAWRRGRREAAPTAGGGKQV